MTNDISFSKLQSKNHDLIELMADWYFDEWKIPREYTRQRLTDLPNDDIIFQLILSKDGEPVATGGLYHRVGLLAAHPKFQELSPWVALLYTTPRNRNSGLGAKLLRKIEESSKAEDVNEIYLHTFTAEGFYLKRHWKAIARVPYKGHTTVVMRKEI